MRTFRFTILVLLFVCLSASGDDWVTVKFGELATIDVPHPPKPKKIGKEIFFLCNDSSEAFMFSSGGISIKNGDQLSTIYDQFSNSMLKSGRSDLISENDVLIDGLKAREIKFITLKNTKAESENWCRVLFVNGSLYNYTHIFLKTHPELQSNSDKFFNSFQLDHTHALNQSISSDNTSYDAGYKIGQKIGFLLIPAILIAVIIILILAVSGKKIF